MLKTLFAAALAVALTAPAAAQIVEKKDVKLGVGGKHGLYYLPLAVADRKGYFVEQGLNIEFDDFPGGARALQALIGGSVDVVTGAYEHTVRMQAKAQDVRAVIELGRYPGIAVGIKTAKAAGYKSPASLKGMKIGVTAPGSSTHMLVNFALATAGLKPEDAAFIGIGSASGAVAAIRIGEIDAISNVEPVITMLERSGDIKVVIDTRSEAGTRALFGGTNPAAVLYTKQDFIARYPGTMQALTNALYKALKWLDPATPEEVAALMPPEYLLGDKEVYIAALKSSKPTYSVTGVLTPGGMKSAADMLMQFDEQMKGAKFDLAKTFDDRFVKKAAETIR